MAKAKKKNKRSIFSKVLRFILYAHLWFWGIVAALSLLYNIINPPVTPLMIQRYIVRGHPIYKREYIKLEKIPQRTQDMLIALEDGNFYQHFGFEWKMVKEAYQRNKKAGKIRFGASTLSNQLARSIFLTTDRNYFRKYLEVQVTIIMEITMTKKRMLELYFNYVEWGKGVYGIETAARAYYGKSTSRLNRSQTMRMISILSNPIKYTPHRYANSASARERMRFLERYF
ncbi:MAG: monofunctional biosynthetic peptidoglycan transglycosylase [Candidatus Cloacimonadales bacterium]|jgi:monofunctional biosynthetic peptidoglycan transglycosylase|nr:monofunctional biosynthetic peptidoglycan transglycosylase [Candidatus Cloacimonadota bacterium]MDY0381207.1 monofunctional biosynthetic peptidoglycan transglycosylase [Candidatus Cloacimonadaceae bacterium]HCM14613.1 monofunctional biosynthetic peptidoglycan transglycosylase [Candidatus Cloacimonas sp.]MCB5256555.1 monofunctional biosynthetic peptidoglycan transglycosylase [Candidatus Cloacimonadota bacterium]MCB5264077.1 monofunctional biosynthetic peptidoglycan transglycosylase [Candidatu